MGLPEPDLGGKDGGGKALCNAVGRHPVRDFGFGDGIGNDAQFIAPGVKGLDGLHRVGPCDSASVVVTPKPGEFRGVGEDQIRLVIGQHILCPEFALGSVQQGRLGQFAVFGPALLQLGKELVMGLGGLNQLHQPGLRAVDEILFFQDDPEGIANVKEDGINVRIHKNSPPI